MAKRTQPAHTATPRAWRSLTLGFGLANVAVSIGSFTDERRTGGRFLCNEHLLPVGQRWWCEAGQHLVQRQIDGQAEPSFAPVTGYEVAPDRFVVLTDEEMEALKIQTQPRVDIERVCPFDSIDPAYFRAKYLMWPQNGGAHGQAFDVLAEAMRKAKVALAGTAVVSQTTETMVVRWSDHFGVMMAHLCHFEDEIRHEHIRLITDAAADRPSPNRAHLAAAKPLLAALDGAFDPSAVEDRFRTALKAQIEAKAGGKPIKGGKAKTPPAEEPDLLDALRNSVQEIAKRRVAA